MADAPSYSRQFVLRQPPTATKALAVDNPNAKKRCRPKDTPNASSHKTLVDAFKQHGTRLCDGSRLNAVGKGIYVLGRVPSTVCAGVTALYLSQNNLRSLAGVEQFAAVRLLSVGGNLVASDKEVIRLTELPQLRNLNLMGNPLCDGPNYRLRVVAVLTKLQVLDNSDVTKKEREAAPHVIAKDNALRAMVTQNHFDIHKLQRIAKLISLHKEFYGRVMAGVAAGRFDRVPSPSDVACKVQLLLRLWRYEDALSEQEQEALQVQMLTIVIRTHAKLADHPKVKAKEYLLKLAKASSPRVQRQDGALNDIKQRCAAWEEAYGNVIALQQKTIANLHAVCEKSRKEMVEFLKELLSMDPRQRNRLVGGPWPVDGLETKPPPRQNLPQARLWEESRLTEMQRSSGSADMRSSQHRLPPQQQDPDTWDRQAEATFPPPPSFAGQLLPRESKEEPNNSDPILTCPRNIITQYARSKDEPSQW
ncbi:Centrosomal protein of 72 kDa [Phytophthora ramorum]